jgi:SAM-dependent methyltransferase
MFARRRRASRPDLAALVAEHLGAGRPTGWFEPLYAAAGSDAAVVPWADLAPHPFLEDWLDDPVATPPGRRAAVVGCGLGDDAALLAAHGYEVTAFDVAPSAVAWARRRFPDVGVTWLVADLLELPAELRGTFDLVVEVRTVPSLPGVVRDAAMHAIGTLAAPAGVVLVVALLATGPDAAAGGPPWPQAPSELAAYVGAGLVRLALEHPQAAPAGPMEVRLTLQRPRGPEAGGRGLELPVVPGPRG